MIGSLSPTALLLKTFRGERSGMLGSKNVRVPLLLYFVATRVDVASFFAGHFL